MTSEVFWQILGIQPSRDLLLIRRAYVSRLKTTNPEDDSESFQRLRQAYEAAICFAKSGSVRDEILPLEGPETLDRPFGSEHPVVAAGAASAAPLVQHYLRLSSIISNPDAAQAEIEEAFGALMRSDALENVSTRLEIEIMLAQLLLSHTPRTRRLIVRAAEEFGWTAGKTTSRSADAIRLAAKYAEDLRFLEQLEEDRHYLAGAYRLLTREPQPFWFRLRSWLTGVDFRVAELLQILRFDRSSTAAYLNERAVAWWLEYAARPQFSFRLTWLALIAPFPVAAICSGAGMTPATSWLVAGLSLPGILLIAGLKLYVVDRGKLAFRRSWLSRLGSVAKLGWLAPCFGLILLTTLQPSSPWIISGALLMAGYTLLWSWYVGREPLQSQLPQRWSMRFLGMLPLIIWIAALSFAAPAWVVAVYATVAVSYVLGEGNLEETWFAVTSTRLRVRIYTLTLLVVVFWIVFLFSNRADDGIYGVLSAGTLVIALAQRIPLMSLSTKQHGWRARIAIPVVWLSAYTVLASFRTSTVVVIAAGAFLSFCAAMTLVMALVNEIDNQRAAA